MIAKHLLGIVNLGLPLRTLLPVRATACTVIAETIAETMPVVVVVALFLNLVGIYLILERMSYLVSDCRSRRADR